MPGTPDDVHPGDLTVLTALVDAGADLSLARSVRHYLYFPSEGTARSAAEECSRSFPSASLLVPKGSRLKPWKRDPWGLLLEAHAVVVSTASVTSTRHELEALALRHGGEYDGWEASSHP